jgi:hypothetical protein
MNQRNVLIAAVCCLSTVAALAAKPVDAPPVIAFEAKAVVVSNVTRGGSITLFSESRVPQQYGPLLFHREGVVADTSGSGEIRLAVDAVVPTSVWVVVDNVTGLYAVALPEGSKFQPIDVPPNALRRNGKGELFKIDMPLAMLDLLVVRPGQGSWRGRTGDAGIDDDDHTPDGHTSAVASRLKAFQGSAGPPDKFRKDDVLVGIDPLSLQYFVVKVGE